MMAIYTRKGDRGKTKMFAGASCNKNSPQIEAIGAIDELTSALALASSLLPQRFSIMRRQLRRTQRRLYDFSSQLASPAQVMPRDWSKEVTRLEREIDKTNALLPSLKKFILPGIAPSACALHLARTICRRAERRFFAIPLSLRPVNRKQLASFINRLSDWLFVLARQADKNAGNKEQLWRSSSNGST